MRPWLAPLLSVGLTLCFSARSQGQAASHAGSERFLIDHNRIFVELSFVRPDGSIRRALAFVDSGDPNFEFTSGLAKELGLDKGNPIRVRFGNIDLDVNPRIEARADEGKSMFAGMVVEANLPASVLDQYDVLLDYGKDALTIAARGTLPHAGVRIPCEVNANTGLISVHVEIDNQSYAFAIDAGSAYTWVDQAVAKRWITAHPRWVRGVGAVGDANMNGSLPELNGTVLRLPSIHLGALDLDQVGALAVSGGWDKVSPGLFEWYSRKTPEPVAGFIGGNVLRQFRLEIDYANSATYWERVSPPDPHDLDQVGITIGVHGGKYFVIALPTQNGHPTVHGIVINDRLLSVHGVTVTGASMGKVLMALHGEPGEIRKLVLERDGKSFAVNARVTRF